MLFNWYIHIQCQIIIVKLAHTVIIVYYYYYVLTGI